MTYLEKFLNWKTKVTPEDIRADSHNSFSFVIYYVKMAESTTKIKLHPNSRTCYLNAIVALKRFSEVIDWIDFGKEEPEISPEEMRIYEKLSAETKLDKILRWQFLVVNQLDDWNLMWGNVPDSYTQSIWTKLGDDEIDDVSYIETVCLLEQLFEDMASIGCEINSVPPPIQGFEDLYTSFKVMAS